VRVVLLVALLGGCAYARNGPPDAACQIVPSGGCPVDQACSIDPDRAEEGIVECREVTGNGEDVAPCANEAECAAGWTCQDGRCKRYCRADGDCGGPGGLCVLPVIVTGPTGLPLIASGIMACTPDCDPESAARCPAGMACDIVKTGTRFHTDCHAAGAGMQLAPCASGADCAPGFVCQSNDGTLVCLRRCALGGSCADVAPAICTAQTVRPTIDGVEYGVCLP